MKSFRYDNIPLLITPVCNLTAYPMHSKKSIGSGCSSSVVERSPSLLKWSCALAWSAKGPEFDPQQGQGRAGNWGRKEGKKGIWVWKATYPLHHFPCISCINIKLAEINQG